MPRFLLSFPSSLRCLVIPVVGLALQSVPVWAGNQHGPGWQQAAPRGKSNKPAPSPPAGGAVPAYIPKAPAAKVPLTPPRPLPAPPRAVPVEETPVDGAIGLQVGGPPRAVPVEESLVREIPGNGPLGEDALIRLAIANSPDLARRRAEVLIAHAKAKGARDWENPELRIGYAWDHDDRIREAFTENSTEEIRANEQFSSTQSQANLAPVFFPGFGDSQFQSTSGSLHTSRYRTIERRVTPGRYQDVIDTTVYEKRNISGTSRQTTADTAFGATSVKNEAQKNTADRRIVERSQQIVNHPDDYGRDDQLSVLIRFKPPNPWERRAKIEIAAAATARAESDYLIEEDKVVRTVRALYEDLNMGESLSRASISRRSTQEKTLQVIEAANWPDTAGWAADIRLEVAKSFREQREFRSDITKQRQVLATYCGLARPEHISVPGRPTRRMVPVEALDVDYLISMAQLHRSDLLDLQSRLTLAKAELLGTKAAKIPFFTFIDAGWATAQTEGRTGEANEWSVRAGISLPIFDWFGLNKAHLEHEAATDAYTRQIEEQRRLIGVEIRTALQRIRSAAAELGTFDKDFDRVKADAAKSVAQMTAEAITNADNVKARKMQYQNEELVSKFEQDRYEVWSDYYKAVMALEHALGTRLERVLNR